MAACSKILFCDDCTASDCYWVANDNKTNFCFETEEEIHGAFPYYSGPEDGKDGCPPWSRRPDVLETSTLTWPWVVLGSGTLIVVLALIFFIFKRGRSLLRSLVSQVGQGLSNFPLRRSTTEVELQERIPIRRQLETIPEEMDEIPL